MTKKSFVEKYLTPTIGGVVATVPSFYLFELKSAVQIGGMRPKWGVSAIIRGIKASPLSGAVVAAQIGAHSEIEERLDKHGLEKSFARTLAVSGTVGLLSSPLLIALNGMSMGQNVFKSITGMSRLQFFALGGRETAFVATMKFSEQLSRYMRGIFGDSIAINYGSPFIAGVVGCAASHPFDTAVTRSQVGIPIKITPMELAKGTGWKQLMRGAGWRCAAGGTFVSLIENTTRGVNNLTLS
jgi:hypothetical protein